MHLFKLILKLVIRMSKIITTLLNTSYVFVSRIIEVDLQIFLHVFTNASY